LEGSCHATAGVTCNPDCHILTLVETHGSIVQLRAIRDVRNAYGYTLHKGSNLRAMQARADNKVLNPSLLIVADPSQRLI